MVTTDYLDSILQQINRLLEDFTSTIQNSKYDDYSDIPEQEFMTFITGARAAIHRISGTTPEREGFKDASAVIAGSSLEAQLRQLCLKNGIEVEYEKDGEIRPKKADKMNSDLAKSKVYSKTDQKSVTSWLGIRNDAAHGNYENYADEQVAIMITAIRDFLTRNPA